MNFEEMFALTQNEKQKIEEWASKIAAAEFGESIGGLVIAFEFHPLGNAVYVGTSSYQAPSMLIVRE